MNAACIEKMRCPVCRATLALQNDGRTLACTGERIHTFDLSRSGYVNLALSHHGAGDAKDAIRARSAFLDGGYYQNLSDTVNRILDECRAASVLDAGCGEGYYTNRMAAGGRIVLGADLSKDGIENAAKTAKRTGNGASFVVGSLFELPVGDRTFDAITNLFAPCAEREFLRVLRDGGTLIVVGAGEDHLMGLKRVLYDRPYRNPGRADLPVTMRLLAKERLRYEIEVEGQAAIQALFSMTPYSFRTSPADRAKLEAVDRLVTEVDFDIFVYRKA